MKTVVYQSYRTESVPEWINRCQESVRDWASDKGFDYRFWGDEAFDLLPDDFRARAAGRLPILSDLSRLLLARQLLTEGYGRTIWIDADVLIFNPDQLEITVTRDFSFCREIWVQEEPDGKLKVYRNVHNALCVFVEGNSFLDFYIDACQRIVGQMEGEQGLVNQIIGPKLLTSLHNTLGYPLIETVGMLSPPVLRDIDRGGGAALDVLVREKSTPLYAANLCDSLSAQLAPEHLLGGVSWLLENRGGKLGE